MQLSEELGLRILAELAEIKARLPASAPEKNRSLPRKQAAQYLGLHEKTLAELTATAPESGKVVGYKTGSRWKYRVSDLDKYRDDITKAHLGRNSRERVTDWSA